MVKHYCDKCGKEIWSEEAKMGIVFEGNNGTCDKFKRFYMGGTKGNRGEKIELCKECDKVAKEFIYNWLNSDTVVLGMSESESGSGRVGDREGFYSLKKDEVAQDESCLSIGLGIGLSKEKKEQREKGADDKGEGDKREGKSKEGKESKESKESNGKSLKDGFKGFLEDLFGETSDLEKEFWKELYAEAVKLEKEKRDLIQKTNEEKKRCWNIWETPVMKPMENWNKD